MGIDVTGGMDSSSDHMRRIVSRSVAVPLIVVALAVGSAGPAVGQSTSTSVVTSASAADVKGAFAAFQDAIASATQSAAASSAPQGSDGAAQASSYVRQLAQLLLGAHLL